LAVFSAFSTPFLMGITLAGVEPEGRFVTGLRISPHDKDGESR